jgi:hypothetical protein
VPEKGDIVIRLRLRSNSWRDLFAEAAYEIDRLRAAVVTLTDVDMLAAHRVIECGPGGTCEEDHAEELIESRRESAKELLAKNRCDSDIYPAATEPNI